MKSIEISTRLDISIFNGNIDIDFEILKNIDMSIFLENNIDIVSNSKLLISPITILVGVVSSLQGHLDNPDDVLVTSHVQCQVWSFTACSLM